MAEIQGVAHNVRIEQEGRNVILRFVLEAGADRIPVEMRGVRVLGVLDNGDQVTLTFRGGARGRDGVARPVRITNLSTHSVVRVARQGCLRTAFSFVFSVALSIVTGAFSTFLLDFLLGGFQLEPVAYTLEEGPEAAAQEPILLIGVAVAIIVFFIVFVRPRLRRA